MRTTCSTTWHLRSARTNLRRPSNRPKESNARARAPYADPPVKFPELEYIPWAKAQPPADINLARSGVETCPASLLGLQISDLVTTLPVTYGYEPLREAIANRYRVEVSQVFPVSGGTSYANWIACAAILDGGKRCSRMSGEERTTTPSISINSSRSSHPGRVWRSSQISTTRVVRESTWARCTRWRASSRGWTRTC